jgi:hypothetical protein
MSIGMDAFRLPDGTQVSRGRWATTEALERLSTPRSAPGSSSE